MYFLIFTNFGRFLRPFLEFQDFWYLRTPEAAELSKIQILPTSAALKRPFLGAICHIETIYIETDAKSGRKVYFLIFTHFGRFWASVSRRYMSIAIII